MTVYTSFVNYCFDSQEDIVFQHVDENGNPAVDVDSPRKRRGRFRRFVEIILALFRIRREARHHQKKRSGSFIEVHERHPNGDLERVTSVALVPEQSLMKLLFGRQRLVLNSTRICSHLRHTLSRDGKCCELDLDIKWQRTIRYNSPTLKSKLDLVGTGTGKRLTSQLTGRHQPRAGRVLIF